MKADLYTVTNQSSSPSIAYCSDNDDVLITGGCDFISPIGQYFGPVNADDPTQPAGYQCFASGGPTAIATAVCLTVN